MSSILRDQCFKSDQPWRALHAPQDFIQLPCDAVGVYMHACHDSCWGNELVPSPGSIWECMGEVKPWTALKHGWEVISFGKVRIVCEGAPLGEVTGGEMSIHIELAASNLGVCVTHTRDVL